MLCFFRFPSLYAHTFFSEPGWFYSLNIILSLFLISYSRSMNKVPEVRTQNVFSEQWHVAVVEMISTEQLNIVREANRWVECKMNEDAAPGVLAQQGHMRTVLRRNASLAHCCWPCLMAHWRQKDHLHQTEDHFLSHLWISVFRLSAAIQSDQVQRPNLIPTALSCILRCNYSICRPVTFCLRQPAQAEIKAWGASAVIELTRVLLLHSLSVLKHKWKYQDGCMDSICLNSRRKRRGGKKNKLFQRFHWSVIFPLHHHIDSC